MTAVRERASVHGHVVLKQLLQSPMSREALATQMREAYGSDANFHTCDVVGMSFEQLFELLVGRGKIVEIQGQWSARLEMMCADE